MESIKKYALTDEIAVPTGVNKGLTSANPQMMKDMLGEPRSSYSQNCQPLTNPTIKAIVKTESIGPFRVTGLKPAIESLRKVMSDIKTEYSDVYEKLSSRGMLCCRYQRRSKTKISNHSWGTAIDLALDDKLDKPGNDKVYYGLSLIAPIFNKHGWYWGAVFSREDAMHFEVSKGTLKKWQALNKFEPPIPKVKIRILRKR